MVAPEQPNIQKVTREAETGFLLPTEDIQALTDYLLWTIAGPGEGVGVGETARPDALANHTWRSNAERVVDIAARLVGARQ